MHWDDATDDSIGKCAASAPYSHTHTQTTPHTQRTTHDARARATETGVDTHTHTPKIPNKNTLAVALAKRMAAAATVALNAGKINAPSSSSRSSVRKAWPCARALACENVLYVCVCELCTSVWYCAQRDAVGTVFVCMRVFLYNIIYIHAEYNNTALRQQRTMRAAHAHNTPPSHTITTQHTYARRSSRHTVTHALMCVSCV